MDELISGAVGGDLISLIADHLVEIHEKIVDEERRLSEAILNCWLFTSVNKWCKEQERLVVLTNRNLYRINYNFNSHSITRFSSDPIDNILAIHTGELVKKFPLSPLRKKICNVCNNNNEEDEEEEDDDDYHHHQKHEECDHHPSCSDSDSELNKVTSGHQEKRRELRRSRILKLSGSIKEYREYGVRIFLGPEFAEEMHPLVKSRFRTFKCRSSSPKFESGESSDLAEPDDCDPDDPSFFDFLFDPVKKEIIDGFAQCLSNLLTGLGKPIDIVRRQELRLLVHGSLISATHNFFRMGLRQGTNRAVLVDLKQIRELRDRDSFPEEISSECNCSYCNCISLLLDDSDRFISVEEVSLQVCHRRELEKHLPLRLQSLPRAHCSSRSKWVLLYLSSHHGTSLQTFYRRVRAAEYSLTVFRERNGPKIFGAFCSQPWNPELSKGSKYYGNGECFLFSADGTIVKVFRWAGPESNTFFMLCNGKSIALGGNAKDSTFQSRGGFGLWVNFPDMIGSSCPCDTFRNTESLASKDQFSIDSIECWGFGDPYDDD